MGADGHIRIFDRDKVEEKLSSEQLKVVYSGDNIYNREIFGRRVITLYFGDNIYARGDYYDDIFPHYRYYEKGEKPPVSEEEFDKIWRIMDEECLIDTWEVWT